MRLLHPAYPSTPFPPTCPFPEGSAGVPRGAAAARPAPSAPAAGRRAALAPGRRRRSRASGELPRRRDRPRAGRARTVALLPRLPRGAERRGGRPLPARPRWRRPAVARAAGDQARGRRAPSAASGAACQSAQYSFARGSAGEVHDARDHPVSGRRSSSACSHAHASCIGEPRAPRTCLAHRGGRVARVGARARAAHGE